MKVYRYENPFRPNYEGAACIVWIVAAAALGLAAWLAPLPSAPFLWLGAIALLMAIARMVPAVRLYRLHTRLKGYPFSTTTLEMLRTWIERNPEHLWLGRGFNWSREQTQMVTEMERNDPERVAPRDADVMGQTWIHGIGEREQDIGFPIPHTEGHTLIVGTTGAGKTVLASVIAAQLIMRNHATAPEAYIAIDPKNDQGFLEVIRRSAACAGRSRDVFVFNPSFPKTSVRIDTARNWNRATEIATSIAVLIPSTDAFSNFGGMALNLIVGGLLIAHEKPTLVKLRRYLEGEPEQLLLRSFNAYFAKHLGEGYHELLRPHLARVNEREAPQLCRAYIQFYREKVHAKYPSTDLEGLIGFIEKNRDWVGKMLGSLMPILHQLTSGTLGPLLSPDSTDEHDQRPIVDFATVIQNREIFVAQLSSLEDPLVAAAIGSLLIADLKAVAGAIYNYELQRNPRAHPTNIFVDELEACTTDSMISLLSRSRGAGFRLMVATQNALPDLAARLNSEHKARMVLGNLNGLISLRVMDAMTQKWVTEKMGKTFVYGLQRSQSTSTGSSDLTEFKGSVSESETEKEVDLVAPRLLNALPNLEYIASLSGGRIVKGRYPAIARERAPVDLGFSELPTPAQPMPTGTKSGAALPHAA